MSGEYNTFYGFLKSNKLFAESIESDEKALDFNINIELVLLYLRTRLNILKKLKLNNKEILEDIIINNNYQIIDNKLVYKDEIIELEHLLEIVRLLREQPDENEAKVLYFKDFAKTKPDSNIISLNTKVIPFIPPKVKTYEEKSQEFNLSHELDNNGIEYTRETKIKFRKTMDKIIDAILNNDLNSLDEITLQIISGLLDIYSLNYYYHHNKDFISTIEFPINKIVMGEYNYKVEEIREYEKEIEHKKWLLVELMQEKENLSFSRKSNQQKFRELKFREDVISLDIMRMLLEVSNLRRKPSYYNPHLLENVMNSIEQNQVEINLRSSKPRIILFNTGDDKVIFHAIMNLDIFASLFDKEELLDDYQLKKRF